MSTIERGGLKAAFANFKKPEGEQDAEMRLLGREVANVPQLQASYQQDTKELPKSQPTGLVPRPLLQREAVRQLSFRCPVSITAELRKKAAFNQLEQQEIIVEGLRRVLADLPAPPADWEDR